MPSISVQVRRQQAVTFLIGWCAYSSTYLLRKPIGIVKADMEVELGFTPSQLGWLDTALWFPYAAVGIFFGSIGDRFSERYTFAACLFLSSCSMITFGWWSSLGAFITLLFINGAAQALCWPCSVKAVTSWFTTEQFHGVVGVFDTSAFAGGVIATGLAVELQEKFGWRYIFLPPSLIVLFVSVLVFLYFRTPTDMSFVFGDGTQLKESPSTTFKPPTFREVLQIPAIVHVTMAAFCLKLVRYAIYMWLPMYLYESLHYTKTDAGFISTVFEMGGIVGTASIGLIVSKFFNGNALRACSLLFLLSAFTLILFTTTAHWGTLTNCILLFTSGLFNCAPGCVLGGSIPATLAGRQAASSVVSLVSGVSSVGTFLEGPLIGRIAENFGWQGMLYLMVVVSLIGTAFTYRASVIQKRPPAASFCV